MLVCPRCEKRLDVWTSTTFHETARIAGTSVNMIEAHYGALVDTARESLLERLEAGSAGR